MCLLTVLLKMLLFIQIRHVLCRGWALSLRNVRSCGCLRMRDSSSWPSPPLLLLHDIHSRLLTQYDCKEVCAPSQPQGNVGASARLSSQDGIHQQEEAAPLSLPQLNCLHEASFARDESSTSNAGVAAIPSQLKVTQQILLHWKSFRDLALSLRKRMTPSVSSFTSP